MRKEERISVNLDVHGHGGKRVRERCNEGRKLRYNMGAHGKLETEEVSVFVCVDYSLCLYSDVIKLKLKYDQRGDRKPCPRFLLSCPLVVIFYFHVFH